MEECRGGDTQVPTYLPRNRIVSPFANEPKGQMEILRKLAYVAAEGTARERGGGRATDVTEETKSFAKAKT